MASPEELLDEIDQNYNISRGELEQKLIDEKKALDEQFEKDLQVIRAEREQKLIDAGLRSPQQD